MTGAAKQTKDGMQTIQNNQSDGDHEVDDWNEKQIGFLARTILSRVKARKETTGAGGNAPVVSYAQTKPLGRKRGDCLASKGKGGGQPGFRVSDFPSQQGPEATGCPVRDVGSVVDRTARKGLVLPKYR